MAEEVTDIAIRHGVDPRDYSLVAYGAAGPMLLPVTLDILNVKRIIVPPHPGLFSALGLLSADLVYTDSRSAYVMLGPETASQVGAVFAEMEERLRTRVGAANGDVEIRRSFDGRLFGQSWETPFIEVPDGPIDEGTMPELVERFHTEYERRFGSRFPMLPVQGVTYRVQLVVPADKVEYTRLEGDAVQAPTPTRMLELRYLADAPLSAAEYEREALPPGSRLGGPAIIREPMSTTFVAVGQVATVGSFGEILIEREDAG